MRRNSRLGRKSPNILRVLSLSLLIVVSVVGIGVLSHNVAAVSVHNYDWKGYRGNSVIYMSTGLTDTNNPNIVSTVYDSTSQTKSQSPMQSVANAVNVSAGHAKTTTDTQWMFNEYYVGGGTNNYLLVNIPFVAGGGTDIAHQTTPEGFFVRWEVGFQNLSVSPSGAPADLSIQFNTAYNSGLNVSGSNTPSNDKLATFGYETACQFLKYLDWACYTLDTFLLYNDVTAAYESQPGSLGNSPAYVKFQTSGGSYTKNLFTPQTLVTVKIPQSAFMSYAPVLNISATNLVGNWIGSYLNWVQPGATAWVRVSAVPAVTITGAVNSGGTPLANYDVVLSTSAGSDTVYYHIKTSSNGKYRFLAEPNKVYTLSATQQTYFGPVSYSNTFTTPNDATSLIKDIALASSISGTVKNSAGTIISGASVQFTNPSGAVATTWSDSSGKYTLTVNAIGTYTLMASKIGYYAQTKTVNVAALGTANPVPAFSLTRTPPDFTISSCGYRSLAAGGVSTTCAVALTSLGFVGTVTLSATLSPVVSGGPTISLSPTSVSLSLDGQGSASLTMTSGSATGQFTITVTGTSGSLTHSTTVSLNIAVGGGGNCPPNCNE